MNSMISHQLVSFVFLGSLLVVGMNIQAETESRTTEQLTSQDQSNSEADINLTRQIRQAVVAQESFSTDAKNIKIITINGVVTLKGSVKTANEKNEIRKIAVKLAGTKKVINQISVE